MKEWKGTKGSVFTKQGTTATLDRGFDLPTICDIRKYKMSIRPLFSTFNQPSTALAFGQTEEECIENANLIVDAFTTIQKCGLMPSELLEQRDRLLHATNELLSLLRFHGYNNSTEISEANELINKITNK